MQHGVWKHDGRRTGIYPSISITVNEQQSTSQRAGGGPLQILLPIRLAQPQAQRDEQPTGGSVQEGTPTDTSGDSCNEVTVEVSRQKTIAQPTRGSIISYLQGVSSNDATNGIGYQQKS